MKWFFNLDNKYKFLLLIILAIAYIINFQEYKNLIIFAVFVVFFIFGLPFINKIFRDIDEETNQMKNLKGKIIGIIYGLMALVFFVIFVLWRYSHFKDVYGIDTWSGVKFTFIGSAIVFSVLIAYYHIECYKKKNKSLKRHLTKN